MIERPGWAQTTPTWRGVTRQTARRQQSASVFWEGGAIQAKEGHPSGVACVVMGAPAVHVAVSAFFVLHCGVFFRFHSPPTELGH
jgi:hypothetical protein